MATAAYLKSELAALKTNPAYRGRQTAGSPVVPNGSNLPAGASINGNQLDITGTVDLDNFDLTGLRVKVAASGDLNSLTNCYLHNYVNDFAGGTSGWINNTIGGRVGLMKHNTFDGKAVDNLNGAIHGQFETLRGNLFLDIGRDYLKPDGNQSLVEMLIEGNYFAEPRTFGNDASDWVSGQTYAVDEVVFFQSSKNGAASKYFPFWSKGNGNVGNSPPAAWNDGNPGADPHWFPKDPHVDMLQTSGTIHGPITVRWNHLAFRPNPRSALFTAGIWFRPFTAKVINHQCDAYENWLDGTPNGNTVPYYPRMMSCDDGGGGVKPRFYNNWAESPLYKVYRGGSAMLWGGNTRFNDSAIPLSDSAVLDSGGNSSEFTPAARASTFPAGGMLALTGGGSPTPPDLGNGSTATMNFQVTA